MGGIVAVVSAPDAQDIVRQLSWVYRRDEETIECRLRLTSDDSAYELHVRPAWGPTGIQDELFDDAVAAFDRQVLIERRLIADGWSLERFESTRVRNS
jgi:hypothetical protein